MKTKVLMNDLKVTTHPKSGIVVLFCGNIIIYNEKKYKPCMTNRKATENKQQILPKCASQVSSQMFNELSLS